jgi:PKD repeat protein
MKKKYFKLYLVLSAFTGFLPSWAQISEGGLPPSFKINRFKSSGQPYKAIGNFDVYKLLSEDDEREKQNLPPRCAQIIPANLNIENSGEWTTLPSGQRIWNLEINAPDALAVMLYYDRFELPEGSKLFIYNPDHSKVLGAYTHKTNLKKCEFATEFVPGDRIILEYVEPFPLTDKNVPPQISINGIAYGYNHLRVSTDKATLRMRGLSGSCMVNINCSEGSDWQNQKKGVARILTRTGSSSSLCSGTLINNTSGDFDPLFLSAHHCFEGVTASDLNQTIYYFNYELSDCNNLLIDPDCPTMVGAQMLVDLNISGSSDGALLRLNDSIPENYDVYFNGWDRRNIPATSGVGIHHPKGDVKKISTFTAPATSETWYGNYTGAFNAHWNVYFSATENGYGVVEGGSSGSPLFNQNKLVVGTLTGGNSACNYPVGVNLYGKLWYHWDQGAQLMSDYLDPQGLKAEFIEGVYINYKTVRADFFVDPNDLYITRQVQFVNRSRNAVTWEWTFEGGIPAASNEENPPLVVYNTPGIYTVSLIVDKGLETEKTKKLSIEITTKEYICPEEYTIGNSSSTSQYPLGALQKQSFSSALYTVGEIGLEKGGNITHLSWKTRSDCTVPRTLYVYLKETADTLLTTSTWEKQIEDATLVYTSAYSWQSAAGWVTVTLPKAFKYSGEKNLQVIVRTKNLYDWELINSNCYYTPVANRHLRWMSANDEIPGGNGIRDNNRPDIRINMNIPCGVYKPVADFLTDTFAIETPAEFLIEDTIAFTNLSKGPAVNWKWSFPGGIPESSMAENPSVVYNKVGTYPITLEVSNHLGADTIRRMVSIKGKLPEIHFSSSSDGFTTYPVYGQFLPYTGGAVSFTDESTYYPIEWHWKLEGSESNLAEGRTITVNYPAGEYVSYPVTHSVSNETGTNTKTVENYIVIGGTSPVWNIPYGDEGNTYYQTGTGEYLTGTNSEYSIIAEKFTGQSKGSISQVALKIGLMNNVTGIRLRTYTVSIYDEKEGSPGNILASVSLLGSNINQTGYSTVVFPAPVAVSGNFYIAMKGMSSILNPQMMIAVASSKTSSPTVYVYKDSVWTSLEKIDPYKRTISLNIVPTFTYEYPPVEFVDSTLFKISNKDNQKKRIEFVSNEKDWSINSDQEWIKIEKDTVNKTAFNIFCEENPSGWRKGTITVKAGINKGFVTVWQAGVNPSNLQAEYDNETNSVFLTWEHPVASEEPIIYRIYRTGELIGEALSKDYTDTGFSGEQQIRYNVSAVYHSDNELESTLSDSVCVSVGTNISAIQEEGTAVKLFPNPAKHYLTVRSRFLLEKITVRNIQGQLLHVIYPLNKAEQIIQTSDWKKGVYIVAVQTQKDLSNYKIIKD